MSAPSIPSSKVVRRRSGSKRNSSYEGKGMCRKNPMRRSGRRRAAAQAPAGSGNHAPTPGRPVQRLRGPPRRSAGRPGHRPPIDPRHRSCARGSNERVARGFCCKNPRKTLRSSAADKKTGRAENCSRSFSRTSSCPSGAISASRPPKPGVTAGRMLVGRTQEECAPQRPGRRDSGGTETCPGLPRRKQAADWRAAPVS